MSSLSSLNRNVLRISGLSSGLDTESIVTSMMTRTRTKVDNQFRTHTQLQWKQDKYKEINNELRKLKDDFSTVLKQEQNMLSEMNYRKYSVKWANENDSAYVDITAEPSASISSATIDFVKQLAAADSVSSSHKITGTTGEGMKISSTMWEVQTQIEAAGGTGFGLSQNNSSFTVSLDGKQFTFSAFQTLESAINQINAGSQNMKLSYSQLTDSFKLESRTSGSASTLSFQDNSFLSSLGLSSANIVQGQDALLSINGVNVTRSSNNFQIDGINYTLKKTFGDPAQPDQGKNVTFSLTRDVDSSVAMVRKYVDAYNELIDKLNTMLTEKPKRTYKPLTDDEKGEMTEKQIEQWETLAKSGMMRNDNQLQSLMSNLRMGFYTKVPGSDLMLADIGLGGAATTMQGYQDAKMGKIAVDEAKLREALTKNPEQVFAMFTASDADGNTDNMGLARRVNTLIDNYIKNNEQVTQYYNDQAITRAKDRYDDMVTAMYKEEDRLWARFTALEKLMSNINSQSQWIGKQMLS